MGRKKNHNQYIKITTNHYVTGESVRPKEKKGDSEEMCACAENAAARVECTRGRCMLEQCENMRFQRCQYARVEVGDAGSKGQGLYAAEDIKAGSFVIEYIGEVLSMASAKRRLHEAQEHGDGMSYIMELPAGMALDASRKGNAARMINHSCEPNCETQKWLVKAENRIGIFAKHFIPKGTELSYDYGFVHLGGKPARCCCASRSCKGFLGGRSALEAIICQVCGLGNDEAHLLICEGCQGGWHSYCAGLEKVPSGNWYCDTPRCRTIHHQEALKRLGSADVGPLARLPRIATSTAADHDPPPAAPVPSKPGLIATREPSRKRPHDAIQATEGTEEIDPMALLHAQRSEMRDRKRQEEARRQQLMQLWAAKSDEAAVEID